jgi:hypothetical protein
MALTDEGLKQIQSLLESEAPASDRVASVRQAFPNLSLTRCDASDMDTETPVLETSAFNVYLLDTSEHCVRITRNPAAATGLIVADRR